MKTLRDRFIAALEARGERKVKETHKFVVYSRSAGGYYYIGRSGSLRFGQTVTTSIPVSDHIKQYMLDCLHEKA